MRTTLFATLLFALVSVCGCGGGGGTGAQPAPTVSGVAATGAALKGTVTLKDAAGHQELSKKTDVNGGYSFDVSGLSAPFILKVTPDSGGSALYSFAPAAGTANLNPLANLVVAKAAGSADLATVYQNASTQSLQGIAGSLGQALTDVRATLTALLAKYGVATSVDPISGAYKIDGTGLDGMFDHAQLALASNGQLSVVETGGTTTYNLNSDFATFAVFGSATLNNLPFANVQVSVVDAATGNLSFGSVQTDAAGAYRIAGLPRGSYTVRALKDGYSFQPAVGQVGVTGSDVAGPVFRSALPYSIFGTVLGSNGAGLAGVTVSVVRSGFTSGKTAVTDGNGRYQVTGLTNAVYTVTPSRMNAATGSAVIFDASSKTAQLSTSTNYSQTDFQADIPAYTVSGSVKMHTDNAALPRVALTLVTLNNAGVAAGTSGSTFQTVSDRDGNFSLAGIPSGYYAIAPVLTGYDFSLLNAAPGATMSLFLLDGADLTLRIGAWSTSEATGGVGGIGQ
ncbi:hypothetical protein GMLC_31250 [Geomonas limicola]|uniref:Lipoprotein n=1 Tax=Geomonas limicola TaxID=2740186 RepID=A0A6V8NAL3_9BACT|nr:carboxypeptidase-like regulatory domain-containing protein [Geomonas limicola]GFO69546.1 hypothetical protein GMLC_31250 [Geomonas limicola]